RSSPPPGCATRPRTATSSAWPPLPRSAISPETARSKSSSRPLPTGSTPTPCPAPERGACPAPPGGANPSEPAWALPPRVPATARIDRTRQLPSRPFGVNLFVPGPRGDSSQVQQYARRLAPVAERAGVQLGEPRWEDDEWAAKLDLLAGSPVALVSFVFGCPSA